MRVSFHARHVKKRITRNEKYVGCFWNIVSKRNNVPLHPTTPTQKHGTFISFLKEIKIVFAPNNTLSNILKRFIFDKIFFQLWYFPRKNLTLTEKKIKKIR